jgi:valyl-tRNA synthetase
LLPIKGLLGLDALAGRLANPNFAGKAPPEVVAECQASLAEAQAQAELVRGRWGSWAVVGAAESEP